MCDIYAVAINFTVDKGTKKIKNSFGAIMSIIFIILIVQYLGNEFVTMYKMKNT